eukprot:COSAG01_NODE_2087_length_8456_cov_2.656456_12_plen_57_part_00
MVAILHLCIDTDGVGLGQKASSPPQPDIQPTETQGNLSHRHGSDLMREQPCLIAID